MKLYSYTEYLCDCCHKKERTEITNRLPVCWANVKVQIEDTQLKEIVLCGSCAPWMRTGLSKKAWKFFAKLFKDSK